MDKRQRMTLLGIAAAIAVAAVVIALVAGGGDDEKSDTTTQTQATQTQPAGGDTTETKPKPPPEPEVTAIRVKGGAPVGGVEEIEAKKGDTVRIDVTSDTADELHLHVYDVEKPLAPGKTTRLKFKATVEGVVELELHGSGTQIAEITVEP
jgi:FtsP/CotA-like multicopper oxidase with cupredoxin domain